MSKDYDTFMEALWKDYIQLSPDAERIAALLETEGEILSNDHIAFRTYDHARINIDAVAEPFLSYGFVESGEYTFKAKKLRARHYQHSDPDRPKIFISELCTGDFSESLQKIVRKMVDDMQDPGDCPLALLGRAMGGVL